MNRHEEFVRPLSGSLYYADLCFSFTVRVILYTSILLCVGILIAGCSRTEDGTIRPAYRDVGISPNDQGAKTQNDPPQGGDYEKSDCAPRKPSG
jgi:hypothetical protein